MTGKQLAAFKHPDRDTVSAEASACVALGKDNPEIIAAQLQRYTEAGFDDRRLFECSMILREHTTAVADFNNLWWDEIQRGSVRDQLSMPWALAHSKPVWGYIPGCRTHSPWCNFYEHGSK